VSFPIQFPTSTVPLQHAKRGELIATFREATEADVDLWEKTWQPQLRTHQRADGEWHWREHVAHASLSEEAYCFVLSGENELFGFVYLTREKNGSRAEASKDTVYVEYVGVAPEHQLPPVGQKNVAGIGRLLMLQTVRISMELGLEGRVGLHSKQEVEGFYKRLGMVPYTYEDTGDGKWLYFETGPNEALQILGE
jgi:hypothetical protein